MSEAANTISEKFTRYDYLNRFLPGILLVCLISKFTAFDYMGIRDIAVDLPVACAIGLFIDAIGSYFAKYFVTKKEERANYNEYIEASKDVPMVYTLEIRRILYRNVTVMLMIFVVVKIYEMLKNQIYTIDSILIVIVSSLIVYICWVYSIKINEYKQKRIEIWKEKREEA